MTWAILDVPWRRGWMKLTNTFTRKYLRRRCLVLEKTLESPLDNKIKPVDHKGNQPWILIGRTDAETETPVLWPLDVKTQLTGKDPDGGKDWRQEDKGMTEDEMARWHTDSRDMNLGNLREIVRDREAWHAAVHRFAKLKTWLRDWTKTTAMT